LEHTYLLGIDNKRVTIGVPAKMKFLGQKLNADDALKRLTTYMTTFWGPGYSVEVRMGAGGAESLSPKELEQKREAEREAEVRRQVENHPLVKSAKDVFSGEIQSIKERT